MFPQTRLPFQAAIYTRYSIQNSSIFRISLGFAIAWKILQIDAGSPKALDPIVHLSESKLT